MARAIDLTYVIESDAKQIYEEYSLKHAYPSLADGLCNVNRSILYAFMHDYKGEKTKADTVSAYVQLHYHLHAADSIHRTALMMASERLPLITAADNNTTYANREGIVASRYASYYKTRWGEYMHKSLATARMIRNYSLTDEIPAYYPTMLPYMLFTNYTNINMGVTNNTLPFNPGEIFSMMRVLLRNFNAPIEELLPYFKGPDIGPTYTVVGHPQSRHALLKDGYGKFDILTNMEFTRDTILFKDVPYRSNKSKFLKKLSIMQLQSAILGKPDKRASTKFVMSVPYKLNPGFTVKDLQKELYTQTTLKKTIAVELVGFHPSDTETVTSGKLDIIGIREMLQMCLKYGYDLRIKELENEIVRVNKEVEYNSLLEKLTRPEIYDVWFEKLISAKGVNREEILFKRGNEEIKDVKIGEYVTIKGGITRQEVKETFARSGNNILGNLDSRHSVLNHLESLDEELKGLHNDLLPENVFKHLDETISDWIKDPICERQSQILFSDIESAITTKCEASEDMLVKHMLHVSDDIDIPVNFVFYKDGSLDYWNPEKSINMPPEFLVKEIHTIVKCNTQDTLLILTSARRFKTKVKYLVNNLNQYNQIYKNEDITFQGVLIYEWNVDAPDVDDYLFMLTSQNRVKKMTISSILQKFEHVKPLPLYTGEYIKYMKVIPRKELDNYTVEVLTARGIKRKSLDSMLVKSLKGFVTLVSCIFERDTVDFRLCHNEPNIKVIDDGNLKEVPVDMEEVFKRDIYKEFVVEEEGKYNHFVYDKEYYNSEGCLVEPKEVFSITTEDSLDGALAKLPENYYSAHVQVSKTREGYERAE